MTKTSSSTSRSKIPLSISTGYIFLRPEEIISIQSDGSATTAKILGSKQIKINNLLKQIEEGLPSYFFRSHKSHIINLNYMYEYNVKEKFIIMEDESIVPLSRRRVAEFNAFIGKASVTSPN